MQTDERRQNYVTKEDLREMVTDFKGHVDNSVNPLKLTLYGADGRNGVVGDVNDIKTTMNLLKWIAHSGLGSGIVSLFVALKSHFK